ncbi:MAG: subfamily polymerase sigma factor, polymerase sigma-70 factor, subfamily [Parcubacteria group bacterium]|nr:subfamily polymerase sigma factor, polymerase sigma-70 factor, subfamily [Parcubacteria group bacterium]
MEALTLTDEEAARLVQLGEPEMFGVLVERYEEKLLRYGRRFLSKSEDIEDIVQDVFMSAYENIQDFDTHARFSPWIYRIAHNAFVNKLGKSVRDRLRLIDLDTLLSHPAYEDPDIERREWKEVGKMIDKALAEVAPKYREVLVLYYLEELPYKEIADVLSVPQSTVGVRLKRGKEALKRAYEQLERDHGTH